MTNMEILGFASSEVSDWPGHFIAYYNILGTLPVRSEVFTVCMKKVL